MLQNISYMRYNGDVMRSSYGSNPKTSHGQHDTPQPRCPGVLRQFGRNARRVLYAQGPCKHLALSQRVLSNSAGFMQRPGACLP